MYILDPKEHASILSIAYSFNAKMSRVIPLNKSFICINKEFRHTIFLKGESGKMLKAKGSKPINEKGVDETKLKPPSSLHQSE